MLFPPFPYKLISSQELKDGYLVDIPSFCKRNKDNPKCRQFYSSLNPKDGLQICPYGFVAECHRIGDQQVIFSCLNVKRKSDRKLMRKLQDDETIQLSIDKYSQIRNIFEQSLLTSPNESVDFKEAHVQAVLNAEKEALDNAMHEFRNLNTQLVSQAEKLSDALNNKFKDETLLGNLSKNIYALSNLMKVRIESYNLEVGANSLENQAKIPIAIYRKIEKVYKCLIGQCFERNIHISLIGNSYNKYEAGPMLEIALFIIMENAIKYSPEGKDITITFKEDDNSLCVEFNNWALKAKNGEEKRFKERGYRGSRIIEQGKVKGRGIGFYLLHQICEQYKIAVSYYFLKDHFAQDGYSYAPFIVKLKFKDMILPEIER